MLEERGSEIESLRGCCPLGGLPFIRETFALSQPHRDRDRGGGGGGHRLCYATVSWSS